MLAWGDDPPEPPVVLAWGAASLGVLSLTGFVLLFQRHDAELAFPLHCVDPGDLLAHGAKAPVALKLPGGGLEPKVEQLDLRLGKLGVELLLCLGTQIGRDESLGHHASPPSGAPG